jgi:3-hydroxybutyryl-CoA dehydrogenase
MLARGETGARAGRGFYDWEGRDADAAITAAAARLRRLIAHLGNPT